MASTTQTMATIGILRGRKRHALRPGITREGDRLTECGRKEPAGSTSIGDGPAESVTCRNCNNVLTSGKNGIPVISGNGEKPKVRKRAPTINELAEAGAKIIEKRDAGIQARIDRLHELEDVIRANLDGWINAGLALHEVQTTKLYRETHGTFEAWARERFDLGRSHAYRLIAGVQVRHRLSPAGDKLPTHEWQVRDLAKLPEDSQVGVWQAACALAGDKEVTEKHVRRAVREHGRQRRVDELTKRCGDPGDVAELGQACFAVILADPAWRYNDGTADPNRQIEEHYPTMSVDAIAALPVEDIAADDSILFLWATAPLLLEALRVLETWGYQYRTHAVWDKKHKGMGYWFRGRHELLLVGVKGKPPKPNPSALADSVILEERKGHSEKPIKVYELIEAYYPELPKVELFARKPRPGWSSWGNEID